MTRINLVPPAELCDQHLLAEHRELTRIPNAVAKGKYHLKGQPAEYKLGEGHVRFFFNKMAFLKNAMISCTPNAKRVALTCNTFGTKSCRKIPLYGSITNPQKQPSRSTAHAFKNACRQRQDLRPTVDISFPKNTSNSYRTFPSDSAQKSL